MANSNANILITLKNELENPNFHSIVSIVNNLWSMTNNGNLISSEEINKMILILVKQLDQEVFYF